MEPAYFEPPGEDARIEPPRFRWSALDLGVFAILFGLTVLFVPPVALLIIRIFKPGIGPQDLSGAELVLIQGVMDLVLVGFVFLIVKMHGESFAETIHWRRGHGYSVGYLMGVGAFLALSVMIISSLLPSSEQTPIEKIMSSSESIYIFAIFGIGLAPLVEEVIFRGFVFKVLFDMRGARVAIPVTTLLFTGLHVLQLWGNWGAIALIFGVGYALTEIRMRSGSLIPSVVIHATYNGLLFGMFAIGSAFGAGHQP